KARSQVGDNETPDVRNGFRLERNGMKIGVCVKAVPDSGDVRFDTSTFRVDRDTALVLNPFDAHAVEEGLRIREGASDHSELVVVSMGPEGSWDAVMRALAMGADRAILLTDEAAAGSDLVATSYALAGVLDRERFDLILFGQQGADSDGAVLGGAVAARLKLPSVSQVSEVVVETTAVVARRQTEFGYERIRLELPALVAVSDAINEPRYPSLRGMMSAKKKPIAELTLA